MKRAYSFQTLIFINVTFVSLFFTACQKEVKTDDSKPQGLIFSNDYSKAPTASYGVYGGTLPASFFLNTPPPVSQGHSQTCAGFASAYGIMGYYLGNGNVSTDYSKVGSPTFIYNLCKVSSDCSDGCELYASNGKGIVQQLEAKGCCTWSSLPFDESSYCNYSTTSTQNSEASANKVKSCYKISDNDKANASVIKSILYSGKPILIGSDLDASFQGANASFIWKTRTGSTGGHAMVVMGYDDSKNAFKILNSWGTSWGDNGYGWIDYNFFSNAVREAFVIEFNTNTPPPNPGNGACDVSHWGNLYVKNYNSIIPMEVYIDNATSPSLVVQPYYSGFKGGLSSGVHHIEVRRANNVPIWVQLSTDVITADCNTDTIKIY